MFHDAGSPFLRPPAGLAAVNALRCALSDATDSWSSGPGTLCSRVWGHSALLAAPSFVACTWKSFHALVARRDGVATLFCLSPQ